LAPPNCSTTRRVSKRSARPSTGLSEAPRLNCSSEGGSITGICGDLGQPRAREPGDAGSTTFCGVRTWQVKVNLLATFATPKDSTHE
jgi:hypothetical protein